MECKDLQPPCPKMITDTGLYNLKRQEACTQAHCHQYIQNKGPSLLISTRTQGEQFSLKDGGKNTDCRRLTCLRVYQCDRIKELSLF